MAQYPYRQARRVRIPAVYLTLALMVASAAVVTFLLWQVLAWFLSFGAYIETLP